MYVLFSVCNETGTRLYSNIKKQRKNFFLVLVKIEFEQKKYLVSVEVTEFECVVRTHLKIYTED